MDSRRAGTIIIFAAMMLVSGILPVMGNVQIPLWQPHDFEFRSTASHANPFMVRLEAKVTGPDGRTLSIPGYYDGDGVWKIRFSPTALGKWSLRTSSDDPELDGQVAPDIECVASDNPKMHGGLRVDPQHPHSFICEDGSRFFMMGYECDWLWAMDATNPRLSTLNALLDKIDAYGFNTIILNVYAYDTSWRKGNTEVRDYGPPPVYPWLGTNSEPDFARLNLNFWRHYDAVIEAMYKRGIVAHILTRVYNKMVNWPTNGSPEDDLYYRTLVARYSAYPNVIWDFSKEAHNEKDASYKLGRVRFIRSLDAYKRLLTVHDDNKNYEEGEYPNVLDFRSDQQHSAWHKTILKQRAQKNWPVVNVEFGYEWGPKGKGDSTYPPAQSPETVVDRAWEIQMAGGYTAYYYTYTAWDIIRPEHTPVGYAYFRNLRSFFEGTHYWLMEPSDQLVSKGYCLADPGREYVVYQSEPRDFTLELESARTLSRAEWYNPLTAECIPAGKAKRGVNHFRTPSGWQLSVLHIYGG